MKNFSFPIEFEKKLSKIYGEEVLSNISKIYQCECPLDISLKNSSMTEKYHNVFNAKKLSDHSLRLSRNVQISSLPGFKEGDWWVQDFSSSLPIRLLGEIKGKRSTKVRKRQHFYWTWIFLFECYDNMSRGKIQNFI